MIVRHGTKPGHQVGIQAMDDDMLHHVDITLMQHSRSDVGLDECIHFVPLLRGGGELGSGQQRWWWGLWTGGGFGSVDDASGGGGAGRFGGDV